ARKGIDKPADTKQTAKLKINFSRSGKTVMWDPSCESLLDFAEKSGIPMDSGCRSGSCGTCLVAVKSGSVQHFGSHDAPGEGGSCLTCICKPETDLTLEV
ncbi:MAG: flavodoxin reductase family protein, partial [Verrucomicrobiales bacterium]|nr:flavodoxin reductase family protein [Verrucomicrobiales bacterium]